MKPEKAKILYVDDEVNNLISFKAAFRRDFDITTAESGHEALKILKNDTFKVIISDQRMPNMMGVDFFKEVLKNGNKAVRILLTGYADISDVIAAVNQGHIFSYVSKPWQEEDLRIIINNAIRYYNTENELAERNIELEKAYKELEKFVYSASHDLRAPLASVSGLIKLVKMENQNPSSADYLEKIEGSIDRLEKFIENIISYYRSAKMEEKVEIVDFETLIDETLEIFRYFENASEIEFVKKINVSGNKEFKSDEDRIKIVINNLISNAIKYQEPQRENKKIEIDVTVNEDFAEINISDNGIGINEKSLEEIFTMFYRSTARNSGSGIGLYIVKETINKMNGEISVQSKFGEGTTFKVKIPNLNKV
ncbi:MAG: hybrid sensor histidine kinase/response regulator [Chitinophagaceae bacterium]|nr:MAG: hybrid sensor histidine kinase/response regulator [Chitinophagaceae bacterium]